MASFGQDLKRERELRGVSLKEISDSTRISRRYIEAIEGDRREVIPGQFFVRAILRSYAKAVGLDETQVLKRYDEIVQFNEQLEYKEAGTSPRPARSGTRMWAPVLALILAIIIAAVLLYVFVFSPRKSSRPPLKAQSSPVSSEVVPTPVTPAREVPPSLAAEDFKDLRLEASFSEDTWLQVYADGQLVWDGIKRAGESFEVKAERELILNSGNAGGMIFTLNGKKAQSLGPRGAVRKDVRITVDDYKGFLLPEGEG
jgi:cytoskeleton protein RodZ